MSIHKLAPSLKRQNAAIVVRWFPLRSFSHWTFCFFAERSTRVVSWSASGRLRTCNFVDKNLIPHSHQLTSSSSFFAAFRCLLRCCCFGFIIAAAASRNRRRWNMIKFHIMYTWTPMTHRRLFNLKKVQLTTKIHQFNRTNRIKVVL